VAIFVVPSLVSLVVQAVGALLIATLCLVLQQTVRREPLAYWSAGWFALFIALVALFFSFLAPFQRIGQGVYIFGEYLFGYLVIAGCRRFVTGRPTNPKEAWLLVPALFFAVYLPLLGRGDNDVFRTVHTLICAYLFFVAFQVIRRANANHGLAGLRVMKTSLLLLTIVNAHYTPLFAASKYGVVPTSLPYVEYAPLYDLIFLVLLAFGMVMLVTGEVQHELQEANARLARTRDRLETMAQLDHLTSALNRHAFYSIIEDPRSGNRMALHGCAAVADVDNLKTINDRYGHAAGDGAIRTVAARIRAVIRADDLLFRWGGDEFLILLIGLSEGEARERLDDLNQSLKQMTITGVSEPVDISVTVGYAPFESAASLDEVIALADTAMYRRKKTLTPQ
jgi:diguanylate cyclase (GGDEF)-like protein